MRRWKNGLACAALILAGTGHAGDLVVVMAAGAQPLSKERVAGVFVGRTMDLKPIDLPDANPARRDFYRKATDRDLAQIRAVWARITFTGLGQLPKQLADDKAVKLAVAADKTAIGYIDKADLDSSVTVVLELD